MLDDAMEYIGDQQDNEESQMNIGYLAGKAFSKIENAYELVDSVMTEAGEVIEGDEDGN
jgi:hypothetical protein